MSGRPTRGAARLAAILDALPDALLLVNRNGTVVNANAVALEAFETPGTPLVGRGLLDVLPTYDRSRIPGSVRQGAAAEPRTKPARLTAHRTDGSTFPAEATSTNLHPGTDDELLMIVVRNLTGSMDVEAELQRQQRQTEMILRAASEGVVGIDADGSIVLVNPAATKILGRKAADLGGKQLHELLMDRRADGSLLPAEECPALRTLTSGTRLRLQDQVLWRGDDTPVTVDLTTAPILIGKTVVGAVMTFTDTEDERTLAADRDRLAVERDQLAELVDSELTGRMREAYGRLRSLAGGGIGELGPAARRVVRQVAGELEALTQLGDELITHQQRSDEPAAERTATTADDLVDRAVETVTALARSRGVQIGTDTAEVARTGVRVDVDGLTRALGHLLADVIAAGEPGSTVTVSAVRKDSTASVRIRGEAVRESSVRVPLARTLIEDHNGTLTRDGTAYVVGLPVDAEAGAQADARASDTAGAGSGARRRRGRGASPAQTPEASGAGSGLAVRSAPGMPAVPEQEKQEKEAASGAGRLVQAATPTPPLPQVPPPPIPAPPVPEQAPAAAGAGPRPEAEAQAAPARLQAGPVGPFALPAGNASVTEPADRDVPLVPAAPVPPMPTEPPPAPAPALSNPQPEPPAQANGHHTRHVARSRRPLGTPPAAIPQQGRPADGGYGSLSVQDRPEHQPQQPGPGQGYGQGPVSTPPNGHPASPPDTAGHAAQQQPAQQPGHQPAQQAPGAYVGFGDTGMFTPPNAQQPGTPPGGHQAVPGVDASVRVPPAADGRPRRLLVWPEPDRATAGVLAAHGWDPVLVRSRDEVAAGVPDQPAALFVDPLTGPITRTALQSLRTAATGAGIPVLVTAGLSATTRGQAQGADPAVLLRALAPAEQVGTSGRVLLVEERPDIAAALAGSLERRGLTVVHVSSEGEAIARAPEVVPNLVVLDLMLVRRQRLGVVDWLRANHYLASAPVVVYTAPDLDGSGLARLRSGELVLCLAERSTSPDAQQSIVDLVGKYAG